MNFFDPTTNGNAGVISGGRPFPGDALSTSTNNGTARDDNHVVTSAHGTIQVPEAGDYTFNFRGDDGFMCRIKAESGADPTFADVSGPGSVDVGHKNIVFFPVGTGDANTRAIIQLSAGVYHLEYVTWEGGGGFWYQVSYAKGFFPNNEDTNAWRPVGFEAAQFTDLVYPVMVGNWTVLSTPPNSTIGGTLAGADAAVDAALVADAAAATSLWPAINFQDPELPSTSRLAGDSPWPRNTPADPDNGITGDDDNFAMRVSGVVRIGQAGNYVFGYQGDDGSKLTIGGSHNGFSSLVENATGASVIGRANTPALNSGTAGAAANSDGNTSVTFQQPGALAGNADTAISTNTQAGTKVTVPFAAELNPATGEGDVAPFTVEAWAKPVSLTGGAQAVVNSMIAGANQNPANGNDRSGYVLRLNNGDWQFYLGYTEGAPFYTIATGSASALENEWQHVVGVWNGTTQALLVNGVKVDEETPATPPKANFAAPLLLGKRGFGDWLFNGDIDEVAVYGTALDDATILSHYTRGSNPAQSGTYPALVQASSPPGYWRLNETVQPRADTGTFSTDVATGNSSTAGLIFLNPGDYPITATFWETAGGASFEIFVYPVDNGFGGTAQALNTTGHPKLDAASSLPLVSPVPPPAPVITGTLTVNPDGTLSLTIQSTPGATYILEESTTLTSWTGIETIVATGTTTTFTGTAGESFYYDPESPSTFYRVRASR